MLSCAIFASLRRLKCITTTYGDLLKHLTTFYLIDQIARTGSIRAAAERIAQTPSAVQRRLQAFEAELGVPIFERFAHGVKLNAAGEVAIHHIRQTMAENQKLQSRLADLSGLRRGHVAVGCSQALTPYFMPKEISAYLEQFPGVTFDVKVIEHSEAEVALSSFSVDIVLVFNSHSAPGFEVLLKVPQCLVAIMASNHPLAGSRELRLRDCLEWPIVLPTQNFGGRMLFDYSVCNKNLLVTPVLESNSFEYLKAHVAGTDAITFQISIGAPEVEDGAITTCQLDSRDISAGSLCLGQLKGRSLSVAASQFLEQITRNLAERLPA